jgi:type IV secretion system protein VirD4
VLASLLHAAAIDGRTMHDVYEWAHGMNDAIAEQILADHPQAASGWLGPIQEVRRPGRTADSIRMTVTRALAWLADPAVEEATSPGAGGGFDVAEFVCGRNTLYMIGTGRDEAPIAPLFRAFAEYVHDGAAFVGSLQPHGRLDPPLLMALDEVTQICPVPLPQWMADSAGKGILVVAICHGLAQLEARWDEPGARAIWDTAGIKVILGGVTDADTLDRISKLCGEVELKMHTRTRMEDGRRGRTVIYQPFRVLPPELLRTLPEWRALVVRGNLSPIVVRLRMAWRRWDYRSAARHPMQLQRPTSERPNNQPQQIGHIEASGLVLLPTDEEAPTADETKPLVLDELAIGKTANRPHSAADMKDKRDAPPLPFPQGGATPPRPRRPWDPPVKSENRK